MGALGDGQGAAAWSKSFALLSDPARLRLLLCIDRAGPISVTDLAVATNMKDTAVSQSLRLLRASQTVASFRDGRIIRYELRDVQVRELLQLVAPRPLGRSRHASS
jgi:DNA-binding transcriptional ArsR family regulator